MQTQTSLAVLQLSDPPPADARFSAPSSFHEALANDATDSGAVQRRCRTGGGICKGASQGLGLRALAKDLGIDLQLEIFTDATAAVGICRRRGLGKIRHLATADLWVQEKLRLQEFKLTKIPGAANPADILTTYVDRQTLEKTYPDIWFVL